MGAGWGVGAHVETGAVSLHTAHGPHQVQTGLIMRLNAEVLSRRVEETDGKSVRFCPGVFLSEVVLFEGAG